MIRKINTIVFKGIEGIKIEIQIQISKAIPSFVIVGLADKTIAESKERVRSAISSLGLSMPSKKITVNLSPANILKEGSHFDLAIASALLASMDILPQAEISEYLILGELSLDSSILKVRGVLPAAIEANAINLGIICPFDNKNEAAWSNNPNIVAAKDLLQLINHFKGAQIISPPVLKRKKKNKIKSDFKEIKGQYTAKRALEIAAAGNHNLIMFGPPGTGKSMLAQRMVSILPELDAKEILESSIISSITGNLQEEYLVEDRPFRSPHHNCTQAAMVGGGSGYNMHPGEVTLAHNGILFLDEFPEFNYQVIESLRQPIEDKQVLIARSGNQIRYPSKFQLVAAMNPCRCGYLNDPQKACSKAPLCAQTYQAKISGPIIDRFDIRTEVGEEDFNLFENSEEKEQEYFSSEKMLERISKARELQKLRYEKYNIETNCEANADILKKFINLDKETKNLLSNAHKKFRFSVRSYLSILKVSRTIADLENSQTINKIHMSEAMRFRNVQITNSIK
ncbi:MAG: YifB family Mg chelatase-like AAA ATPase [Rickettsia sp.]|nr:YifB family Mg chelatase-like AAA ATPase [Rickettsia sp.]